MRSMYQDALDAIREFKETCPDGFEELRKFFGKRRRGAKYTSRQRLIMFDTLTEFWNLGTSLRVVQARGVGIKTRFVLVKMVLAAYKKLDELEYYRWPKEKLVTVPTDLVLEFEQKFKERLKAAGLEPAEEFGYVNIWTKKADGSRFSPVDKIYPL